MRAREFIYSKILQERFVQIPKNNKEIERKTKQYELLSKIADWKIKIADLHNKRTNEEDRSSMVVRNMASNALKRRSIGIYGLREASE